MFTEQEVQPRGEWGTKSHACSTHPAWHLTHQPGVWGIHPNAQQVPSGLAPCPRAHHPSNMRWRPEIRILPKTESDQPGPVWASVSPADPGPEAPCICQGTPAPLARVAPKREEKTMGHLVSRPGPPFPLLLSPTKEPIKLYCTCQDSETSETSLHHPKAGAYGPESVYTALC